MQTFNIGDRVVKNPQTWIRNDGEFRGRGNGVGVVTEPPFALKSGSVEVRWSAGRCFEYVQGLLPAPTQGGYDV